MNIKIDDLRGFEIAKLLEEHLRSMKSISPPESTHTLDIEALRKPGITFWSAWKDAELCGYVALKELDSQHAEIKSMRTASSHLRKGVASSLLKHIIEIATVRGYQKLSLETGSMKEFEPARRLYAKFGFNYCEPFEGYVEDPNSVFMVKKLQSG
jgi:putative acetyltransferase